MDKSSTGNPAFKRALEKVKVMITALSSGMCLKKENDIVHLSSESIFENPISLEQVIAEMKLTMFALNDSEMFSPLEGYMNDILPDFVSHLKISEFLKSSNFNSWLLK